MSARAACGDRGARAQSPAASSDCGRRPRGSLARDARRRDAVGLDWSRAAHASVARPPAWQRDPDNPSLHGFDLSAEDERLLRGPVPGRALEWAAAAVGPSAAVVSCRALAGGTSSAVHGVDGHRRRGKPAPAGAAALRAPRLARRGARPRLARGGRAGRGSAARPCRRRTLVASDPDGATVGVPAILMTMLDGRDRLGPARARGLPAQARAGARAHPPDPRAGERVAAALPAVRPRIRRPPAWATKPDVWLRAIELVQGAVPSAERTLIHRDYHPGNVLWSDRRVSGVVDWVNASIGSPWADVGHCRMQPRWTVRPAGRRAFPEAVPRGSRAATMITSPYWDADGPIGGLDESSDEVPEPVEERFLEAAISRL